MTKSAITRIWIGGLATFGAGIVTAIVGVFLMLAYGGTFTQVVGTDSYDFQPYMNGFFWVTIALIVIGGLIASVGSIIQLVAWVSAVVNSYALPERTWFVALLIGGVLGLAFAPVGFAVMIAYVVGAPDGAPFRTQQPSVPTPQTGTLTPTT
jgi:hypothetical protein